MCILCLRPVYPTFELDRSERAKALTRASQLKSEILEHEGLIEGARRNGVPPCSEAERRLKELREAQYENSRKI